MLLLLRLLPRHVAVVAVAPADDAGGADAAGGEDGMVAKCSTCSREGYEARLDVNVLVLVPDLQSCACTQRH